MTLTKFKITTLERPIRGAEGHDAFVLEPGITACVFSIRMPLITMIVMMPLINHAHPVNLTAYPALKTKRE